MEEEKKEEGKNICECYNVCECDNICECDNTCECDNMDCTSECDTPIPPPFAC
jgi:hypothetical protein